MCVCVENLTLSASFTGRLHQTHTHTHPQLQSHAASLCVVGTPGPGCLLLASWHHSGWYHLPLFLHKHTHTHTLNTVPMHSWHQMLGIKNPVRRSVGLYWKGHFLFLVLPPADFLPVDITSSLSKYHHAHEGNRCINKLCSLDQRGLQTFQMRAWITTVA